jgi:putative acetyltransferase
VSRLVAGLERKGWVKPGDDPKDRRARPLHLTPAGRQQLERIHARARQRVGNALRMLPDEERAAALTGMDAYARALAKVRRRERLSIRPIKRADEPQVAALIRAVMPEFGASGPGFAIMDPEVDAMWKAYRGRYSAYFVVTDGDRIVGGGGVAPLEGGARDTCELRKMYFLPEARGLGVGSELLALCIETARKLGYKHVYLETLKTMTAARKLYEFAGFQRLKGPQGHTGHFGCDAWYARGV